jgi:tetratricopeptide (TPR) repeat protein
MRAPLFLVAVLLAPTTSAQEGGDAAGVGEAISRQREAVAQIERALAEDPLNGEGWMALITARSFLHAFERQRETLSGGAPPSPEENEAAARRITEEALAAWADAAPDDAGPSLYRALLLTTGEPQLDELRRLSSAFPHDSEVNERLASSLRHGGLEREVTEARETFLTANPKLETAYSRLHSHYQKINDNTAADRVLDLWLAAFPDSQYPNQLAFKRETRGMSADERRELVRRRAQQAPVEELHPWCQMLGGTLDGSGLEDAAACYERILRNTDPAADSFDGLLGDYAGVLGKLGEWSSFHELVDHLPEQQRDSVVLRLASTLSYQRRCDEAAALAGRVGAEAFASHAGRFDECARSSAFGSLLLRHLEVVDGGDAARLLERLSETSSPERIEPVLLARLERQPDDRGLNQALYDLYARAGRWDELAAHFARWYGWDRTIDVRKVIEVAGLLESQGRPDEARGLLESGFAEDDHYALATLAEALALLHLQAGRMEDATAVGRRLLGSGHAKSYHGHRLLALTALATDDRATALDHYRAYFAAASASEWDQAGEYELLLAEQGDEAALVAHLETKWNKLEERRSLPAGGKPRWIGDQLAEAGLLEAALPYYEESLERGGDVDLLQRIAELAAAIGDDERAIAAYRRLQRERPERGDSWLALARLHLARQRTAEAVEVIREAIAELANPPAELWTLWTRVILGEAPLTEVTDEALLEAITLLRRAEEMYEESPYQRGKVQDRLEVLYGELGRREPAQ